MRFFEEQRRARKTTMILVVGMIVFVGVISAMIAGAIVAVLKTQDFRSTTGYHAYRTNEITDQDQLLFLGLFGLNALIMIGISGIQAWSLESGGDVASMLGGTPVAADTQDPKLRQLLNVVEEMSLASGIPCPSVYVLQSQPSVNAFAAGFDMKSSAVAVTRGAVDVLTRDELQGVIAHEFSHILNGDMVLNMRIVGVVSGLVFLTELGLRVLDSDGRSSNRRNNAAPLIGLALMVFGGIGVLGSRLLQAAVSRQREFLADASAVQFTRNPNGLAYALAKVRAGVGSRVRNDNSLRYGHLFFADSASWSFGMSTHPPLETRIHKLVPNLNLEEIEKNLALGTANASAGQSEDAPTENAERTKKNATRDLLDPLLAPAILQSIGRPQYIHAEVAQGNLRKIPPDLLKAARSPATAPAVFLGVVLLGQSQSVRQVVLEKLQSNSHELELAKEVIGQVTNSMPLKFTLLHVSLGTLKQEADDVKTDLISVMKNIFEQDHFVSLDEILLSLYFRDILLPSPKPSQSKALRFDQCVASLDTLVYWLITKGRAFSSFDGKSADEIKQRYYAAAAKYQVAPIDINNMLAAGYENVGQILDKLRLINMAEKPRVISILWASFDHHREQDHEQAESVRLVCSLLNVPVPPFIQYMGDK